MLSALWDDVAPSSPPSPWPSRSIWTPSPALSTWPSLADEPDGDPDEDEMDDELDAEPDDDPNEESDREPEDETDDEPPREPGADLAIVDPAPGSFATTILEWSIASDNAPPVVRLPPRRRQPCGPATPAVVAIGGRRKSVKVRLPARQPAPEAQSHLGEPAAVETTSRDLDPDWLFEEDEEEDEWD